MKRGTFIFVMTHIKNENKIPRWQDVCVKEAERTLEPRTKKDRDLEINFICHGLVWLLFLRFRSAPLVLRIPVKNM